MSKVFNDLYLDYEFNQITEEKVNLVCCVTYDDTNSVTKKWWLHNDPSTQSQLKKYIEKFCTIIGYSTVAEARSFISMDMDPLESQWIDLFIEYRCITNHNDRLQWGKQLVDGKIKTVHKPKPKWERTENEKGLGFSPTHSLAEATFKLLGKQRDTDHKTAMRDLIISNPNTFSEKEKSDILEYCAEDVMDLPRIWKKIREEYFILDPSLNYARLKNEALIRGRYSAHTAIMESRGYPIDVKKTKNFSRQVGNILYDLQREINQLFPEIKPFRWNKKDQRFSENQKAIKSWVSDNHDTSRWMKTDGGQLSLSLEAFEKFYDFKHNYPKDNFGAQFVRYGKLKQSLYGFSASGGKRKNFWDSVGSDGRVRPYMNIYKAQSSRSQPAASGFMFLKPAWMRALVSPAPGYFMAGVDYGQQEFLISALLARDRNMIQAYLSGDPYFAFAKLSGQVPQNGFREDYEDIRNACKNTVLGLSYRMTKYGLAIKLTSDTGRVWTEDEAQEQIDLFYGDTAFWRLGEYQEEIVEDYRKEKIIRLPCGWRMFGDNDNERSVGNVPIQGCLHGDTRVLTREYGFSKIKEIPKNSVVNVWEGKKFVVAGCVPSGKKKLVEITLWNGQKISCSPEHKFLCVNNRGTKETWKKPGDFNKQTFLRLSCEAENFDSNYFPDRPVVSRQSSKVCLQDYKGRKYDLGIILGRLLSDGVVDHHGIKWCVAEHEKEILPKLVSLIGKFGLGVKQRTCMRVNKKPLYFISIYSSSLVKQITQDGADVDFEKSRFMWSSKELMRGFLCGYFDGDGGTRQSKESRRPSSVSLAFGRGPQKESNARAVQKMLTIFGIRSRLGIYGYRTNVTILTKDVGKFCREIGFLKESKQTVAETIFTKRGDKIGRVERVKSVKFKKSKVEMFDIVNCPDKKFSADGLVTHNTGASVMRKAVDLAAERGIYVPFTLHDALYMEDKIGNEHKIAVLRDCMREAFVYYFDDDIKKYARMIKLDPFAWSPDYEKDSTMIVGKSKWEVPCSNLYIDSRSINDYNMFSKYFDDREEDEF